MRYLKQGMTGEDVLAWENFLRGLNPKCTLLVDGMFGADTVEETKAFQRSVGFFGSDVDGIVGNMTLAKAALLGFRIAVDNDDNVDELGPNWPTQSHIKQLSYSDREKLLGRFSYVPAGVAANPEAIKITDDWATKNIVTVNVPQLKGIQYAPSSGNVQVNVHIAKQLQSVFKAWEDSGLLDRVLTWGGLWVPRFIRGSRTTLSNHAWGSAFDINVQWNGLGVVPALKDKKGSVRELVGIANEHGWFWGGGFQGRPDGMHFEAFTIVK
jgi:hypothetical protein